MKDSQAKHLQINVQAERDKLEKYTKMLEQVKERIDSLR